MGRTGFLLTSLKQLPFAACLGLASIPSPSNTGFRVPPAKGIRCTLASVKDTERSGEVAFTYFVPNGWESTSYLKWSGNTYVAEFNRFTPDKHYEVDTLEPMNMSYRAVNQSPPQGTRLTKASDFLHVIADGLRKRGNVTNVQTVEEFDKDLALDPTQALLQNGRPIPTMKSSQFRQSAFLKISFDMDGTPEVATMGTTVSGSMGLNHVPMGFGARQTFFDTENDFYVVGPTLLIVSPVKPTPSRSKEAQLIASSTRMTAPFAFYCVKLATAMSEAALNATEQRGKQLIANMQEQTAKNLENFKKQMADKDATTHDFCNYISDQQDYKKSSGTIVTLPAYYNHAWADDQGHYVLTDDPTYDPKGTGGGNWEQMSKAQHGQ